MNCPKCNYENENNAQFCVECGCSFAREKTPTQTINEKRKSTFKFIIFLVLFIFILSIFMYSLLFFIAGIEEKITSVAICGLIVAVLSVIAEIFVLKKVFANGPERLVNLKLNKMANIEHNISSVFGKNPIGTLLSPSEKLNSLVVQNPSISLLQNEVCYYCRKASAVHQKNVVTGHTSRGAGVSVQVMKGVSVRTGGGASQAIRENVNEYFDGTLYITNFRIILLAPKYGFDIKISKITQLIYRSDGLQIYCGAKCYSVFTRDVSNIRGIIEFLNEQAVFKDEKIYNSKCNNSSDDKTTQELRNLKSLLDDGIITQDEFDAKKRQILGL